MTVTIPGDFDLQKIAASGQAFRIAQTPQGWRFLAGDKLLYLQPGSGDTYTASCTPEEWQGFWHRYFDLNRNYAAIRAAVPKQDAYLCAAARAGAGIRILRQDAWEMLVTFIISQRKNIPAIQACVETLCTRYGAPLLEALMQQHGVGIKVANCVALFAYGRMECAPVDVWIQRVIDQHYAGQNPFPAYGNAGILQQWMFYFARSEKERVK